MIRRPLQKNTSYLVYGKEKEMVEMGGLDIAHAGAAVRSADDIALCASGSEFSAEADNVYCIRINGYGHLRGAYRPAFSTESAGTWSAGDTAC